MTRWKLGKTVSDVIHWAGYYRSLESHAKCRVAVAAVKPVDCGLFRMTDKLQGCTSTQVPAHGSHMFFTCSCRCCMTGSKFGIWPMFRFVPPVLRPQTQPRAPARDAGHRCWAKGKLTSVEWPLPYGAGGHPWDTLWQTPACPGEVISRCTWVWIASCYYFHVFLQVIDLVFILPHPEKADCKPFPMYFIHTVRTELVSFIVCCLDFFYPIKCKLPMWSHLLFF